MLWRQEFESTGYRYSGPHDLDTTAEGDVVAAGNVAGGTGVVRVSSATGSLLWQTILSTEFWVYDVVIDPSGDVFVAGRAGDRYPIWDVAVVKIDGATGTELIMQDGTDCPSFAVLKLRCADGSEIWRRVIPGPVTCGGYASLVAVDVAGDVVAAGVVAMRTRASAVEAERFSA